VIVANDATVKGGTYYPMTVKKHLRAQEIALQNRLPCIYLVDSGGAFLPMQDEVFPDREHFGRIFYNQATMSAPGIPQIACVLGSCTAGGAYVPAMSDETVIVREPGHDLPRRAAAGEGGDRRGRHRRGARRRRAARPHAPASSTTCADDDATRWRSCADRRHLPPRAPPVGAAAEPRAGRRPGRAATAWCRPTPAPPTTCARSSPGSSTAAELHEFKALYGTTLVTGFAHIHGHPVGIVANNGILFSESALKGAHFIELCDQRGSRWCSCRTSPASWSAASTRPAGSPSTAPRWSPRSPAPGCRS
jgi:3-methylcrotonyl-CoA carboxylase beta subunit